MLGRLTAGSAEQPRTGPSQQTARAATACTPPVPYPAAGESGAPPAPLTPPIPPPPSPPPCGAAPRSTQLGVVADPAVYSREECSATLARIHEGSGGLQLVCKVGEGLAWGQGQGAGAGGGEGGVLPRRLQRTRSRWS